MNRLDTKVRAQILKMLCEGNGLRATSGMTGTSINTVSKLLSEAGKALAGYHDDTVRNVKSDRIQCDEVWSFTFSKAKNVGKTIAAPGWVGGSWTWVAVDVDSKLIISYMVGARDCGFATDFMRDLADRIENGRRVQLIADGLHFCVNAVDSVFSGNADFAQLIEQYGPIEEAPQRRYSPAVRTNPEVKQVAGDSDRISASNVERQNLTKRMHMRRFTRLTNGYSKKLTNHMHMVALYAVFYNFVKANETSQVTPAMAAGVSAEPRDFEWLVEMIDSKARSPKKRGVYNNQQQRPS